jgi:hypothetical protein
MNLHEEQLSNEEINLIYGGNDPVVENKTDVDYDDADASL